MAAVNRQSWIRNIFGESEPLIMRGLFQAGGTQAIKRGELLELDTGNWVPLDADQAMTAIIAVANEEIQSGDRAGYYEILVPRPGDVFEYELATANDVVVGQALYYSDSQTVTEAVGSNILGYAIGQTNYPKKQGHLAKDASTDSGTTVRLASYVEMTIIAAASYFAAFNK